MSDVRAEAGQGGEPRSVHPDDEAVLALRRWEEGTRGQWLHPTAVQVGIRLIIGCAIMALSIFAGWFIGINL